VATASAALATSPTNRSILIRAYPRLHVGLLDLGHATRRRYGGAGFTIGGPCLEVSAERLEPGHHLEVVGLERFDDRARREAEHVLDAFQELTGPLSARLRVGDGPPQHVGLGSKTSLLLALLQAATMVAESPPEVATLQRLSGRGGTSGIGVHSFFRGGFLTDGGHPQTDDPRHRPSSASRPERVPPLLCWLPIPDDWRFSLLMPSCARFADETERAFFDEHTPLPEVEVLRTIAAMYHGVVTAVATGDLGLLGDSLADLHDSGFKARELHGQPAIVRDMYRTIRERMRLPVGLSSLGPTLYVISSAGNTAAIAGLRQLADEYSCGFLGAYPPRNAGYDARPLTSGTLPCG
jgi:beta-ribofuranosylaminobenzene 5'-phosphate synthase